jgi:tetratricopeptide (TPR) repeat protein
LIAVSWLAAPCASADPTESPVGLVMSAGGSKLLRANMETPLDARTGDLLFVGDAIRTIGSPASFLYCPAKALQTLAPRGELRFEAKQAKVKSGSISEKPTASCALPQIVRVATASQQHYGITMTRGVDKPEVPPTPRDQLPPAVIAELAPAEAALAANPEDPAGRVAMAAVFEKYKLPSNALEQYYKIRAQWPDAVWVKAKIFELEQAVAAAAQAASAAPSSGGKTYALLIGISRYQQKDLSLQFADRDAVALDNLLRTPRAGGIPAENLLLLTDEKATTAAVRNGFQDFLKRRATKGDTVILMLSGHGTTETPASKGAYILTYDSDPQDLKSTALPMAELKGLFEEQLAKVGRVILFVDVCKSGTIGSIRSTAVNSDVERLSEAEGDLFGLMASRPRELSLEGPEFGGGHGAFTYFVLKGLQGDADANKDGTVDANELIKYVSDQVPAATNNKQHPREFGTYDNSLKLAGGKAASARLHYRIIMDTRSGEPLYFASTSPTGFGAPQAVTASGAADRTAREFDAAVQGGRVLPMQQGSAFEFLDKLKSEVPPEQYAERRNALQVALEDRAQAVLLRYLTGDQIPQTEQEFAAGAEYVKAAQQLTPESLYLEGRRRFFEGRSTLFTKDFAKSASLLEDSVRIDPEAAYGFNALGIAYLEQAQFEKAIPAFRDAADRAPHWSYPLHNLALAYVEEGDYSAAIRAYQRAIKLTPQFSYLPYNLGLVYQRIGRYDDAETAYQQAVTVAPDSPQPYNALGSLRAIRGKRADAERYYRLALEKDPHSLAARHNLATLLAEREDTVPQALRLWKENIAQSPEYLPSRLSLADAFARANDTQHAIEQYEAVVRLKPDYVAARVALAAVLEKAGRSDAALDELREASRRQPEQSQIFERIGDLEQARGNVAQARAAYVSAERYAPDGSARKTIRKKLKAAGG